MAGLPGTHASIQTVSLGYQHIRMYDLNSNNPNPIISYDGVNKNIASVGFHEDGRWMYTGGEDCTARIWDLRCCTRAGEDGCLGRGQPGDCLGRVFYEQTNQGGFEWVFEGRRKARWTSESQPCLQASGRTFIPFLLGSHRHLCARAKFHKLLRWKQLFLAGNGGFWWDTGNPDSPQVPEPAVPAYLPGECTH